MLHWEFEHHSEDHRPVWQWRALRADGRSYRRSKRNFSTFIQAFEDASRHGFDRERHAWKLATPEFRSGAFTTLMHRQDRARRR